MTSKIPPELKPITAYVLRGKELIRSGADEVVAYHCFKYAVELGIKLNDKSTECKDFLIELMTELEAMKPHLQGKSDEDLRAACENFAQAVFQRADSIDKAGNSDKSTAQTFYAASTFFDILKQFSEHKDLEPDIKQQAKYAKYRAAEILRAIKEGRKPIPSDMPEEGNAFEAASSSGPAQQQPPPHEAEEDIPVAYSVKTSQVSVSTATTSVRTFTPGGKVSSSLSRVQKSDALEYIKFARASLEADDISMAAERLQKALSLMYEN